MQSHCPHHTWIAMSILYFWGIPVAPHLHLYHWSRLKHQHEFFKTFVPCALPPQTISPWETPLAPNLAAESSTSFYETLCSMQIRTAFTLKLEGQSFEALRFYCNTQ
eukprot:jgi/Botrbrau1/18705/Bobra.0386s0031.1